MSTRGAIGIRYNKEDKVAYNHFDSYPLGLGQEVLNWLKDKTIEDLKCEFDSIVLVNEYVRNAFENGFKSEFQDASDFLADSLFCEYAYIINLDSKKLEIYHGFNRNKNAAGRYAKVSNPCELSDGSYMYGVKLVKELPLKEVFAGFWKVNPDDEFVKE